jgi:GDPmannose 4,6-dehydratase
MLLQHDTPEDFVISTGVLHTIRDFCNLTADCFGIKLVWEGVDINEVGRNSQTGEVMVRVNPDFYRPINVQAMHGDSSKIREILQWNPEYSLQDLVHDMCKVDMELV